MTSSCSCCVMTCDALVTTTLATVDVCHDCTIHHDNSPYDNKSGLVNVLSGWCTCGEDIQRKKEIAWQERIKARERRQESRDMMYNPPRRIINKPDFPPNTTIELPFVHHLDISKYISEYSKYQSFTLSRDNAVRPEPAVTKLKELPKPRWQDLHEDLLSGHREPHISENTKGFGYSHSSPSNTPSQGHDTASHAASDEGTGRIPKLPKPEYRPPTSNGGPTSTTIITDSKQAKVTDQPTIKLPTSQSKLRREVVSEPATARELAPASSRVSVNNPTSSRIPNSDHQIDTNFLLTGIKHQNFPGETGTKPMLLPASKAGKKTTGLNTKKTSQKELGVTKSTQHQRHHYNSIEEYCIQHLNQGHPLFSAGRNSPTQEADAKAITDIHEAVRHQFLQQHGQLPERPQVERLFPAEDSIWEAESEENLVESQPPQFQDTQITSDSPEYLEVIVSPYLSQEHPQSPTFVQLQLGSDSTERISTLKEKEVTLYAIEQTHPEEPPLLLPRIEKGAQLTTSHNNTPRKANKILRHNATAPDLDTELRGTQSIPHLGSVFSSQPTAHHSQRNMHKQTNGIVLPKLHKWLSDSAVNHTAWNEPHGEESTEGETKIGKRHRMFSKEFLEYANKLKNKDVISSIYEAGQPRQSRERVKPQPHPHPQSQPSEIPSQTLQLEAQVRKYLTSSAGDVQPPPNTPSNGFRPVIKPKPRLAQVYQRSKANIGKDSVRVTTLNLVPESDGYVENLDQASGRVGRMNEKVVEVMEPVTTTHMQKPRRLKDQSR